MAFYRSRRLLGLLPVAATGSLLIPLLWSSQFNAHCDAKANNPGVRVGSYTYPANNPSEDRHIYGKFGKWKYSGVFDGHGGWQVSELASRRLIEIVKSKLVESAVKEDEEVKLDKLITASFQAMEDEILNQVRPAFKLGFGEVSKVGSCVLLAFHQEKRLIIANCGDCRAVLGTAPEYGAILNRDHNCRVPLEQELLKAKHPNEPNLVVCKNPHACYVKGRLQLTRSLGDAYLKYSEFNGSSDVNRPVGRHIPEPYTPPYVSHEPELHHIRLSPDDKFVILGSDGLWDYLPHTEAVRIVFQSQAAGLTQDQAAQKLVERALEIAAAESGMTIHDLLKLPQGRHRRGRHDDTTAVVMYF
eukprot:gene27005-32627_t